MTADNAHDFAYELADRSLSPETRRLYWDVAMGLQEVDGLHPSQYLRKLAEEHVSNVRSLEETGTLIRAYYQERGEDNRARSASCGHGEREADLVSQRIVEMLADRAFALVPDILPYIHERLFSDLDPEVYRPGRFKDVALQKPELILNGDSVLYADPSLVVSSLKFAFDEEGEYLYAPDFDPGQVDHFSRFIARLWQVHPFFEGNTRTVAVFAILYLRDLGFDVDNEPFARYADYFRDALVRANYRNAAAKVMPDRSFLNRFFNRVVNGSTGDDLRSRDLMVATLYEHPELLRNVDPSRALACVRTM